MKNLKLFAIFFVLVSVSFSCKPIYKCGEQKPDKKLFLPKTVQTVVNERDSLCTTLTVRDYQIGTMKDDIAGLNANISGLNSNIDQLKSQYSELTSENLSQSAKYNTALKQKTDELNAKELLLKERERALDDMKKVVARQDSITKRLNDILRNALLNFKSDELSVEIKNGKVYVSMSDKLLFKSGSAAVENKGLDAIKVLADVLSKNNDIDILIEGHTDNLPIKTALYSDNWDLSVARSLSIVRILTNEYKIPPTRITASGKGEFSPRAINSTPEGRASNRRTEIILSPKLDEIMNLLKYN